MSERLKNIFLIFQIFKIFFEKWLQWDLANIERNKVMKYELILSSHGGIMRDQLPREGSVTPKPRFRDLVLEISVLKELELKNTLAFFISFWFWSFLKLIEEP